MTDIPTTFLNHIIEPFNYLFSISSQKVLTIVDLEDSIHLAEEVVKSYKQELGDVIISDELISDISSFFVCAFYRHFDIDSDSATKFNLEVRTIVNVVCSTIAKFKDTNLRDFPIHVFNILIIEMNAIYITTEKYTVREDIVLSRAALANIVPSTPHHILQQVNISEDSSVNKSMQNILESTYFK